MTPGVGQFVEADLAGGVPADGEVAAGQMFELAECQHTAIRRRSSAKRFVRFNPSVISPTASSNHCSVLAATSGSWAA